MKPDVYKLYDPEFNAEVLESNKAIAQVFATDFSDRWRGVTANVTIDYINFPMISVAIDTNHEGLLTQWYEKVNDPSDFTDIIGELAEPYVDYLSTTRKSLTQQYLVLYSSLGYLELSVTDDGVKYTPTQKPEEMSEVINKFLDMLFQAVENHT